MANETLGASFSIDVSDLKTGLAQANRLIRESESEFKAAAAGMDDWSSSQEGLEAKLKSLNNITAIQKEKVGALQSEYDRLIEEGLDPASKEAIDLRTKINNETAALNKNESEAKKLSASLEKLGNEAEDAGASVEEAGNSAESAGEGFTVMKGAAAELVANGITALISAVGNAISSFFGLAESTREARTNMARLQTSFESAGLSAEAAESTMTELYGVLGDEGRATEAAQQLAKISSNEADLAANTRILTGVMAEYGESIPTEGLAEGMAATAAMGEVQGVLADALEWQGVNLEEYNAQLATLATEEERAAFIQSTLTDLYGESADAYRENNAEVIAAQEAQAEFNQTLNEMGAIVEPIMTTLKQLSTELLQSLMPFVSLIGEGLQGALQGSADATSQLAEGLTGIIETLLGKAVELLPQVVDLIIAIVPELLTALLEQLPTILETVVSMVVQVIGALSSMIPSIVSAVMAVLPQLINSLIASIPVLLEAAIQLLMAIVDAVPVIVTELIAALPSIIETTINALLEAIPLLLQAAIDLLMAIVDAIPTIIDALIANLPSIISTIISGLLNALPQLLEASITLYTALITAIPEMLPDLIAAIPDIITAIVEGLTAGIADIETVGGDLIEGLWNGISNMAGWIATKIQGFGEGVLSSLKTFFGIASPSRVMADEVGKNLALGIGEGFEDNIAGVNDQIVDAMDFAGGGGASSSGSGSGRGGAGGVVVYQTNNYSQAYSRLELYKSQQNTAAAVRLAMTGA